MVSCRITKHWGGNCNAHPNEETGMTMNLKPTSTVVTEI
jgi:hypothetical protein